jgi:hypothetical protein
MPDQPQDPQVNRVFKDIAPETCVRIYDQAIKDWLMCLNFRDQAPTVVTAWMSRMYSQAKELQSDETQRTAMAYPAVSLGLGTITPDLERRNFNDIRALGTGAPDQTNRAYYPNPDLEGSVKEDKEAMLIYPWPLPYSFPYQIDIWTKTRQDWRLLTTSLMARFPDLDTTYICVDIPGYGEKLIKMTLDSVDDTSDLETGEEDRTLRATVSLTLHGWIFRVPRIKRTITKAHAVILDASSDPDNLLDGSDFVDWYCDADHYNFNADGSLLTSVDESPQFAPPNRALFWISYNRGNFTEVNGQ